MKTLGAIIKAKGCRQDVLAGLCKVSEPTMSKWANRRASIPARALRPLSLALDVPIDDIIEVAEPPTQP